jgi:hypothetical protein
MTESPNTWRSQPASATGQRRGGAYHPDCGEEHHHKPTKAMIGVGLLVVLSFLLCEFNGKPRETHSAAPTVQQQTFAANH